MTTTGIQLFLAPSSPLFDKLAARGSVAVEEVVEEVTVVVVVVDDVAVVVVLVLVALVVVVLVSVVEDVVMHTVSAATLHDST